MKMKTALILATGLCISAPGFADNTAKSGEEAETDIEIINGVPVNPELKAMILEMEDKELSVQELIEKSAEVLDKQKDKLAKDRLAKDAQWMKEDPLGHLEGEMSELVMNIDESDTDKLTQQRGEDVVRKMDALIAMMEQAASACQACSGGAPGQGQGQANGKNPADQSTLSPGSGNGDDPKSMADGNNKYEDLDPEQREAILRAKKDLEGVPEEFEALLEEYYLRLASDSALDTDEEDTGDE